MKVVINPKYNFLTDFIYHLPGCFFKDGETIYQGRNILKKYDIQGYRLIVKRFKRPNIINQIVYSFFRRSKARRSFDYSLEVQKRGFGVADPIAYIEIKHGGLLTDSYYISLYMERMEELREYMAGIEQKIESSDWLLHVLRHNCIRRKYCMSIIPLAISW